MKDLVFVITHIRWCPDFGLRWLAIESKLVKVFNRELTCRSILRWHSRLQLLFVPLILL
jgi:hypothetical protein